MLGGRLSLFNDPICPLQERLRNAQAECLGRFEIDDEVEPRGLLDGKVAGFGPFQDPVHEVRGTPDLIAGTHPVGDEPPGLPIVVRYQAHCRKTALDRELRELGTVRKERARNNKGGACLVSGRRGEGAIELAGPAHLQGLKLEPQDCSGRLHLAQHLSGAWKAGIPEKGHSGEVWNGLF